MASEEQIVWRERCIGARPVALLLVWLVVIAVLLVLTEEAGSGLILMLAFIAVAAGFLVNFLWLEVAITPTTLRVAHGPFRTPSHSVPLAAMEDLDAIHVSPLKHGGWGVRKKRMFIARAGPGLSFKVNGRRWIVTIDGAAEAATRITNLTG